MLSDCFEWGEQEKEDCLLALLCDGIAVLRAILGRDWDLVLQKVELLGFEPRTFCV